MSDQKKEWTYRKHLLRYVIEHNGTIKYRDVSWLVAQDFVNTKTRLSASEDRVKILEEALQRAIAGLQWHIDTHPEIITEADHDQIAEWRNLLPTQSKEK